MKFKTSITIAILFLAFIGVQSCKKTENAAPVVNITEPAIGDTIYSGSDVHFHGTASDDDALHEGKLQLLRASDDSLITQLTVSVHGKKSYTFHEHLTVQTNVAILAKAKATFSDHDDAITSKEVLIQLMP